MKEFFRLLRRFVPPYKKYLIWALFLNLLSAILNIFSFALIIPILQILSRWIPRPTSHSLGCGRNQHERHSGQQLLLLRHRDDSLAGRLIDIADFRHLPGGDDPAESILLFRLFRRDDSSPHGRGARHPCASI